MHESRSIGGFRRLQGIVAAFVDDVVDIHQPDVVVIHDGVVMMMMLFVVMARMEMALMVFVIGIALDVRSCKRCSYRSLDGCRICDRRFVVGTY